MKIISLFT